MPAADDERDGDCDEHEQHDVEAVAREAALLPAKHAGVALRTVVAVAKLDRGRIDGGVFLGLLGRPLAGHGPGHP